jgi:histidinol-phosphate phosphatase family protein
MKQRAGLPMPLCGEALVRVARSGNETVERSRAGGAKLSPVAYEKPRWRPFTVMVVPLPEAVLFDRDGTLIADVPFNREPARVVPMPTAVSALARLRRAGIRVCVVSNQSAVGEGLLAAEELAAINRRVDELLGPFDGWHVCTHQVAEACGCRKPEPGLIIAAAEALRTRPDRCVVIGDIGSDVEAALRAGASGILVPTPATRPEEIMAAPRVAPSLDAAVDLVLGAA